MKIRIEIRKIISIKLLSLTLDIMPACEFKIKLSYLIINHLMDDMP